MRWMLAILMCVGCGPRLSPRQQTCVERALRRRDSPEAVGSQMEFDRRCHAGDAASCSVLGVIYERGRGGMPIDLPRAAELYQFACAHGNRRGCSNLRHLQVNAIGSVR